MYLDKEIGTIVCMLAKSKLGYQLPVDFRAKDQ